MPNPSTLAEQEQPVSEPSKLTLAKWRFQWWLEKLPERIAIKIAWMLPKRIALWAMIRVVAHATIGRWGNEHPDSVSYKEMHDRWGIDNGG